MIKKYLFIRNHDAHTDGGGGAALLTEAKLIGQATEAQITEWKEKYKGKIYGLQVDGHIAYFQNPSRVQMNIAMSKASTDTALDMYEMLAKLTKIGGSEAVLTDDEMFYGIGKQLKAKMDGKQAVLVNL
jgi:hypothetical protein